MVIPYLSEAHNNSIQDEIPSKTPSKGVIIAAATKYIKDLESEKGMLLSKTRDLQEEVAGMRELVGREATQSNSSTLRIDNKDSTNFGSR